MSGVRNLQLSGSLWLASWGWPHRYKETCVCERLLLVDCDVWASLYRVCFHIQTRGRTCRGYDITASSEPIRSQDESGDGLFSDAGDILCPDVKLSFIHSWIPSVPWWGRSSHVLFLWQQYLDNCWLYDGQRSLWFTTCLFCIWHQSEEDEGDDVIHTRQKYGEYYHFGKRKRATVTYLFTVFTTTRWCLVCRFNSDLCHVTLYNNK